MMTKSMSIGVAVGVVIFCLSSNVLAGQYDGTYKGVAAYKAGHPGFCASVPMVITIKDQKIHWSGRFEFDGSLQSDGSFTLSGTEMTPGRGAYQFVVKIEGKVDGGKIVGTESTGECEFTVTATRSN